MILLFITLANDLGTNYVKEFSTARALPVK